MSDQHPHDPDQRLRRLLGEPEPGDEELIADPEMHRLLELLDSIGPDDQLETPPPGLWDAIAEGAASDDDTAAGDTGGSGGRVVRLRGAAPPWWLGAAAAVVVIAVVAVGALAIFAGRVGDPEQLATADLEVLVEDEVAGEATLVRDHDDVVLQLEVDGLTSIDGYYEVWLLTPEVDGLVSLGPLRSDGRYELPDGLDHTEYSVVDVSVEPHDGDPTHSGNSVLRGGLVEA
ncbi:MAG: anti-sigma factor [Acidimicrobiales bacterium]